MEGKEELEILISEDGGIKVHIKGIRGPACRNAVKNFSAGIGKITEIVNTAEFYQKEENAGRVKNRGSGA